MELVSALTVDEELVASYITIFERGYAVHELTFAPLFIVLIAFPLRHRQRWAWWAAWFPTIANLGYTVTFVALDNTTLARGLREAGDPVYGRPLAR
jgi:hypothetical protein